MILVRSCEKIVLGRVLTKRKVDSATYCHRATVPLLILPHQGDKVTSRGRPLTSETGLARTRTMFDYMEFPSIEDAFILSISLNLFSNRSRSLKR